MPTATHWVNPQKTIHIIPYIGNWTISEMYSTFSNSNLTISCPINNEKPNIMPTAHWINFDQTVYFLRFIGKWTALDVNRSIHLAYEKILEVKHPVVMLIDLTDSESMPDNLIRLATVIANKSPNNLICVFVFGDNLYLPLLTDIVHDIYGGENKFKYASSYEMGLKQAYSQLMNIQNADK